MGGRVREFCEKRIEVGFERNAKNIFDEIESVTASLIRDGWTIEESTIDETMGFIDIIFFRDIFPEGQERSNEI